jgi:hypothetical protein
MNTTNSKGTTIARIRLPPSGATTFKQSEFIVEYLINAMPNTQHRAIANICSASYTEEFLAHVNIRSQARLVRAAVPTAGEWTVHNKHFCAHETGAM